MCQNLWPIQDLPVTIRGVFEISNFNQFYTILTNRKKKIIYNITIQNVPNCQGKGRSKGESFVPKAMETTFYNHFKLQAAPQKEQMFCSTGSLQSNHIYFNSFLLLSYI